MGKKGAGARGGLETGKGQKRQRHCAVSWPCRDHCRLQACSAPRWCCVVSKFGEITIVGSQELLCCLCVRGTCWVSLTHITVDELAGVPRCWPLSSPCSLLLPDGLGTFHVMDAPKKSTKWTALSLVYR